MPFNPGKQEQRLTASTSMHTQAFTTTCLLLHLFISLCFIVLFVPKLTLPAIEFVTFKLCSAGHFAITLVRLLFDALLRHVAEGKGKGVLSDSCEISQPRWL